MRSRSFFQSLPGDLAAVAFAISWKFLNAAWLGGDSRGNGLHHVAHVQQHQLGVGNPSDAQSLLHRHF